jgi:protein-tyrosine phosphatase
MMLIWGLAGGAALLVAAALVVARNNRVEVIDPVRLVIPMSEADLRERDVPLEGGVNFRDVGGYVTVDDRRVRRGLLYRSGALHAVTDNDLARLADMGIKLVCDLRSHEEVQDEPDRLPPNVRHQHMPLQSTDENLDRRNRLFALLFNRRKLAGMMPEFYRRVIIDQNARLYGSLLRQFADPANLPAVVHCTAGKDRTGVAAALLLTVLGVPEETVVADYALSNRHYRHFYEYGNRAVQSLARLGIRAEHIQPLLIAHPQTIRGTLAHIRERYGGIESYLREAAGLDEVTLARLRSTFLE